MGTTKLKSELYSSQDVVEFVLVVIDVFAEEVGLLGLSVNEVG